MSWFGKKKEELTVNHVDGVDYLRDADGQWAGRLASKENPPTPSHPKKVRVISLGKLDSKGPLDTPEDNLIFNNFDRFEAHKKQKEKDARIEQERIRKDNELKEFADAHRPALLARVELERTKLAEQGKTFESFPIWSKPKWTIPAPYPHQPYTTSFNQEDIKNILLKKPSEWTPAEAENLYKYFNDFDEETRIEKEQNRIQAEKIAQAKIDAQALVDAHRDEVLEFLRQEKIAIMEAKHSAIAYYEALPAGHQWSPTEFDKIADMFPYDTTIYRSLKLQIVEAMYARRISGAATAEEMLDTIKSIVED